MKVGWLLVHADEVADGDGWLSAAERNVQDGLRFPKRRGDWRLGRWAAKRAVAAFLGLTDPAVVAVIAAADGAPEAFVGGTPADVTLSISHRGGTALCAVAAAGVHVGCDLEAVEHRSDAFSRDYLTPAELERVESAASGERDVLVTLLWSAKESALKGARTGLRADTRSVEVEVGAPDGDGSTWRPISVRDVPEDRWFKGWWRRQDNLVMTVLGGPAAVELEPIG